MSDVASLVPRGQVLWATYIREGKTFLITSDVHCEKHTLWEVKDGAAVKVETKASPSDFEFQL